MSHSAYDAFASFYNRYWASPHLEWQAPALEQLLFPHLKPGAHILDLCCGTGQLARKLCDAGYRVTGVDGSAGMLDYARKNAPDATFIRAEASAFQLDSPVDAVVCTFDSLNHLLQPELVARTFACVHRALKPGGHFVFDINTPSAYGKHWDRSAWHVEPSHAFIVRGAYHREARLGTTEITMFELDVTAPAPENWRRCDVEVSQRPWEPEELRAMLTAAGFEKTSGYRPLEDLGMTGHFGDGRVYLAACRSSNGRSGSQSL